jgi:hypothetical protein
VRLAEQHCQQYTLNAVPDPSPDKHLMTRICDHLTIIVVAKDIGQNTPWRIFQLNIKFLDDWDGVPDRFWYD